MVKRIVTDKELEANASGGVFRVSKDMILTPFARDFAQQNGIALEYGEGTAGTGSHSANEDALTAAIREIVEAELGHLEGDLESVIASEVRNHMEAGSAQPRERDSISTAVTTVLAEKHRLDRESAQAVITVAGENHSGIVARVSQVLGELGSNIVDISQTVVGEYFTMILVVDIGHLEAEGIGFSAFRDAIQAAARNAGVAANVMHEDILKTMHRVV